MQGQEQPFPEELGRWSLDIEKGATGINPVAPFRVFQSLLFIYLPTMNSW